MNKYNVRAIRRELDNYLRNRSWGRILSRLQELHEKQSLELVESVVLTSSKLEKVSLLHGILKVPVGSRPKQLDLVSFIVRTVPRALFCQDSKHRTALHIALKRSYPVSIVNELVEGVVKHSDQSVALAMFDSYNDTPLLLAARQDNPSYILVLLEYCSQGTGSLMLHADEKGRCALGYVAKNVVATFSTNSTSVDSVLPYDFVLLLLATHFAVLRKEETDIDPRDWAVYRRELQNAIEDPLVFDRTHSQGNGAFAELTARAFITSAHLLELNHAMKIVDFFNTSGTYRNAITSFNLDGKGNSVLHLWSDCGKRDLGATDGSSKKFRKLLTEKLVCNVSFLLYQRNERDELPLHLATASQCYDSATVLTSAYPNASGCFNGRGEIPLHIALKAGSESKTQQTVEFIHLINQLWRSHPSSLQIRDGPTQLYPFQLLASTTVARPDNEVDAAFEAEQLLLSSLFSMLLAAPHLLAPAETVVVRYTTRST